MQRGSGWGAKSGTCTHGQEIEFCYVFCNNIDVHITITIRVRLGSGVGLHMTSIKLYGGGNVAGDIYIHIGLRVDGPPKKPSLPLKLLKKLLKKPSLDGEILSS